MPYSALLRYFFVFDARAQLCAMTRTEVLFVGSGTKHKTHGLSLLHLEANLTSLPVHQSGIVRAMLATYN